MHRNLLLVLTIGLFITTVSRCWAAEPQTEREKAIAEIRKQGGGVGIDEKSPDKPAVAVILTGPKVTDSCLEHLQGVDPTPDAGPSWEPQGHGRRTGTP